MFFIVFLESVFFNLFTTKLTWFSYLPKHWEFIGSGVASEFWSDVYPNFIYKILLYRFTHSCNILVSDDTTQCTPTPVVFSFLEIGQIYEHQNWGPPSLSFYEWKHVVSVSSRESNTLISWFLIVGVCKSTHIH